MPCAIAEIRDFYGREDVSSNDDSTALVVQFLQQRREF